MLFSGFSNHLGEKPLRDFCPRFFSENHLGENENHLGRGFFILYLAVQDSHPTAGGGENTPKNKKHQKNKNTPKNKKPSPQKKKPILNITTK